MTITRNFSVLANGAGSANNLSLGGATLGSNALAVTGTAAISGAATAASINFGGSTLSVYATGSWTPTDGSGASLSFTSAAGSYTRIGNLVYCCGYVQYPSNANASNAAIGSLPYTSANNDFVSGNFTLPFNTVFIGAIGPMIRVTKNATTATFWYLSTSNAPSQIQNQYIANGSSYIYFSFCYPIA
jgi:hypothetical protein